MLSAIIPTWTHMLMCIINLWVTELLPLQKNNYFLSYVQPFRAHTTAVTYKVLWARLFVLVGGVAGNSHAPLGKVLPARL